MGIILCPCVHLFDFFDNFFGSKHLGQIVDHDMGLDQFTFLQSLEFLRLLKHK